jgi:manganese transport protein
MLIVVGKSNPVWANVFVGFLPQASIFTDPKKLYIAIGILGATVVSTCNN